MSERLPPGDGATCPRCAAPRVNAPDCPRCGVIYARAEARARAAAESETQAAAVAPAAAVPDDLAFTGAQEAPGASDGAGLEAWRVLAPPTPDRDAAAEETLAEQKLRWWVVPAALVLAFLFVGTGFGGFVSRLISGMWLHELGHATAAWFCGYNAVPLPWVTQISDTRSFAPTVLLAGGFGYLAWRRRAGGELRMTAVFAGLALAAVVGRFLPVQTARALTTFWGDGGALVYGALLMTTFYVPPGSWLHRGMLRWGFVGLGALGFADVFATWWAAWGDPAEIPFGRIERVGLSDASKLVDVHGWSETGLVQAHLVLGALCLVALAVRYAWDVDLRRPAGRQAAKSR